MFQLVTSVLFFFFTLLVKMELYFKDCYLLFLPFTSYVYDSIHLVAALYPSLLCNISLYKYIGYYQCICCRQTFSLLYLEAAMYGDTFNTLRLWTHIYTCISWEWNYCAADCVRRLIVLLCSRLFHLPNESEQFVSWDAHIFITILPGLEFTFWFVVSVWICKNIFLWLKE